MKFVILFLSIIEFSFASIIHEPPINFIPMFPVTLEISFSKPPKLVQVLYKHLSNSDFKIKTMKCKIKRCKATVPTTKNSPLQYLFQVKETQDDNNLIQSKQLQIPVRTLPSWQILENSSPIIIFGQDSDLQGFHTNNIQFDSEKGINTKRIIKYTKNSLIEFSTTKKSDEVLSEFANDPQEDLNEEAVENNEENSFYKELFTP